MARWLTSAGMPPNFHRTATGTLLLVLSAVALAAVLIGVVRARRRLPWQVWLVVSWLLVPLALTLAESLAGQPIALARNSLLSLPAFALVLAWGLTASARVAVARLLGARGPARAASTPTRAQLRRLLGELEGRGPTRARRHACRRLRRLLSLRRPDGVRLLRARRRRRPRAGAGAAALAVGDDAAVRRAIRRAVGVATGGDRGGLSSLVAGGQPPGLPQRTPCISR